MTDLLPISRKRFSDVLIVHVYYLTCAYMAAGEGSSVGLNGIHPNITVAAVARWHDTGKTINETFVEYNAPGSRVDTTASSCLFFFD